MKPSKTNHLLWAVMAALAIAPAVANASDGTFNVGTFRPWAGYAMSSGRWESADLNGDGRTDLVHLTDGDYAHTWMSNGDGTEGVQEERLRQQPNGVRRPPRSRRYRLERPHARAKLESKG